MSRDATKPIVFGEGNLTDNERIKLVDGFKAEVALYSGKTIIVDLMRISTREFREITDEKQPQHDEATVLSRACGMTIDEILSLPLPEYRLVASAFVRLATMPLANPTSPSASTSQ
jgi:hypothetical protein